jgi:hypothetical protein
MKMTRFEKFFVNSERRSQRVAGYAEKMLRLAGFVPGQTYLDFGCGPAVGIDSETGAARAVSLRVANALDFPMRTTRLATCWTDVTKVLVLPSRVPGIDKRSNRAQTALRIGRYGVPTLRSKTP